MASTIVITSSQNGNIIQIWMNFFVLFFNFPSSMYIFCGHKYSLNKTPTANWPWTKLKTLITNAHLFSEISSHLFFVSTFYFSKFDFCIRKMKNKKSKSTKTTSSALNENHFSRVNFLNSLWDNKWLFSQLKSIYFFFIYAVD